MNTALSEGADPSSILGLPTSILGKRGRALESDVKLKSCGDSEVDMSERPKTVRIDPRDFIGGPFEDCPKCRQHEFGVLHIYDNSYTRRCRSCWHTLTFILPELRKKVIYLDQFVFSNIMKTLSSDVPGHKRAKTEPLWRELFETLDVLCRMQLVICPDSSEHHDESLISPFYEELKHTYEHFSTGISFTRSTSIQEMQIVEAFHSWLTNKKPDFDFDARRIAHPNLHGWQDRIFITTSGTLPGYKQSVLQSRRNVHGALGDLFRRWQTEKKSFEKVFELEKAGYADSILQGIERDRQKAAEMASVFQRVGPVPRFVSRYSATMNTPLMHGLQHVASLHFANEYNRELQEGKLESLEDLAQEKVIAFLKSGAMNETPSNIIAASMYAALARRAVVGQKKVPDEGMATDIRVVSTLLPYCDAMFVDNVCRSLLNEIPQTHKQPYKCRVFSSKTSSDFLQYLIEIRNSTTPKHLRLLEEVYGSKVFEPPKEKEWERLKLDLQQIRISRQVSCGKVLAFRSNAIRRLQEGTGIAD